MDVHTTNERPEADCNLALGRCRSDIKDLESFAHSLVESEARAKSILETAADAIIIISSQGIIELFNPAAEKMFGWRAEEIIGQNVILLMPDPHRSRHDQYIENYLKTGQKKIIGIGRETMAQRKDGTTFPIELAVSEAKIGDRSIFTGFIRDITARRQSASALEVSEERFRLLVETMNDGLAVQDAKGRIIYVNPRFCEILGYQRSCLIGRRVSELMDFGSHIIYQNELKDESVRDGDLIELNMEKEDGEKLALRVSAKALHNSDGEPMGSFLVINDITQIKRLQRQLIHSQKMEAVGRLAGGIAHDFNNLLMIISGYVDMSLKDLDKHDPLYGNLEQINEAANRAATLTRQLLAFSRKQVMQPTILNLPGTLTGIEHMLQRLLGSKVDLVLDLDPNTALIKADESQMEQVFFNLAVNAHDAMPDGGTFTISTANVQLDDLFMGMEPQVPPGAHVVITVSDTGIGMNSNIRSQIFEPFFTTKEKGQGTGLGLSTVYGIIKQSGGEITVYSEPGHGTSFRIYMPTVKGALEPAQPTAASGITECGNETILVVEDETAVREMLARVLGQCGYEVIAFSDGPAALQQFAEKSRHVDLVITDVMMPKMNGREFADKFTELQPQARVLFMSGFTDDAMLEQNILAPYTMFIHKPFTQKELMGMIAQLLSYGTQRS